jgi:phosphoribosylanthranilate isomerase
MCGMTRTKDIAHAISLGVDAVGFIFYEKSSRNISLADAKPLISNLPPFVDVVAVVVNPDASFVKQIISELSIQCLQFHGEEEAAFCEQFGLPYIKAVPAISMDVITAAIHEYQYARAILLDTPSIHGRGGSGVPFDWNMVPQKGVKPIILAGGLDAQNVGNAIATCAPYAVDVCSGIETSAGIKDHEKMSQFVNSVRGKK